ncbi:MAG: PSP1 domain-containing protein [Ardenticatenaceae bacterium]
MQQVTGVRFRRAGKIYNFINTAIPDLNMGDFLVVKTSRGLQLGWVGRLRELTPDDKLESLKPVLRKATSKDLLLREYYRKREKDALKQARMAAVEVGVRLKLARADYSFDGTRITFYYGTEKEIQLRPLQRHLTYRLNAQIDFRQVGPRDVAKMMGGAGACGLAVRCCSAFLTDFQPISIRMAKEQDIPLVPTEIAGMCGRLRCCLAYEYEFYKDAGKGMPKIGNWVTGEDISGKVVDRNMIKQSVILQATNGIRTEVPVANLWVGNNGQAPAQGGSCGTDGDCGGCSRHS